MEPKFKVVTIASTPKPQTLVWQAARQDYSAYPVYKDHVGSERTYGLSVIDMLLKGGKGHYGCLEHPQITFNGCYFPHSCVMQLRTHRVGVSFDVQSFRYTSSSILLLPIEEGFYFRPPGFYTDRFGHKYTYTEFDRERDIELTQLSVNMYRQKIESGFSEEHARECLTTNYRQQFVFSANLRSLWHILDLRYKKDAELEIQQLSQLLFDECLAWTPELTQWYQENRLGKAKLSP